MSSTLSVKPTDNHNHRKSLDRDICITAVYGLKYMFYGLGSRVLSQLVLGAAKSNAHPGTAQSSTVAASPAVAHCKAGTLTLSCCMSPSHVIAISTASSPT